MSKLSDPSTKDAIFNCIDLKNINEYKKPGQFFYSEFYLSWLIGICWYLLGISKTNLWPVFGILYGFLISVNFIFFRAFYSRNIAIIPTAILAFSPLLISFLPYIRDFSKAPFLILCAALLISILREEVVKKIILKQIFLGIVIGVGVGFRADLVVMIPISLILLTFPFTNKTIHIKHRVFGLFSASLFFVLFATPLLLNLGGGGLGTAVLQGAAEPFNRNLNIPTAIYDVGSAYSDELTIGAGIASDLRNKNPDIYDLQESLNVNEGKPSQAYTKSTVYLFKNYAGFFPADIIYRAFKSTFIIVNFYQYHEIKNATISNPFEYKIVNKLYGKLVDIEAQIGRVTFLAYLSCFGILLLLTYIYSKSKAEFLGIAVLFLFLLSYPSIQFSLRHFFYLIIYFWLGLTSLVLLPWFFTNLLLNLKTCFKLLFGFFLIYAIFLCINFYQNYLVRDSILDILSGPKTLIPLRTLDSSSEKVLLKVPVPEIYKNLITSDPDDMGGSNLRRNVPKIIRAGSARLLVTINPLICQSSKVDLYLDYKKTGQVWQETLERKIPFNLSQNRELKQYLIFSSFYRPTQFFNGLSVKKEDVECIEKIELLNSASDLTSLLTIKLIDPIENNKFTLK